MSLLDDAVSATHAAGRVLLDRFDPLARPADRDGLLAAVSANEDAVAGLLPDLPVGPGERWVVDAVEGNVNHVHGRPEWGVTLALVRDDQPVLAVVHEPVPGRTWTAVAGAGAHLDGRRLAVSTKSDLGAAVATTGQAEVGQDETYDAITASVGAMLRRALLVRMDVPSTFLLLRVADGQGDVFWQYAPSLSGVAAGVLLAREAGAVVTDVRGRPWHPGSPDLLVAVPGVHAAAVEALA